jgi:uncharacterized protein (DUF305 family)
MQDYNQADVNFVQKMIAHHSMAITMSNRLVALGKNDQVHVLAIDIKNKQSAEIQWMKNWLLARGIETEPQPHSM